MRERPQLDPLGASRERLRDPQRRPYVGGPGEQKHAGRAPPAGARPIYAALDRRQQLGCLLELVDYSRQLEGVDEPVRVGVCRRPWTSVVESDLARAALLRDQRGERALPGLARANDHDDGRVVHCCVDLRLDMAGEEMWLSLTNARTIADRYAELA